LRFARFASSQTLLQSPAGVVAAAGMGVVVVGMGAVAAMAVGVVAGTGAVGSMVLLPMVAVVMAGVAMH
jgi:hypothetical protein